MRINILSNLFDLDIVTILIAWIYLFYGKAGSTFFAFCGGFITDVYSGGFSGLFTSLYILIYGGIRLSSQFFDLSSIKGQIVIISGMVLIKEIIFFALIHLFLGRAIFSPEILWFYFGSAISSGLVAPLLFAFLNRLNRYIESM